MNLYFLVEGKRTEPRIYPIWLSMLLPHFTRILSPDEVTRFNYFIISGLGFPALLDDHLVNSIEDVNKFKSFSHLIIVLDSEEETVENRKNKVNDFIDENNLKLNCELKIIVQHRCIETWLLGNKKVLPWQPIDAKLSEFIRFYNVFQEDPEGLPKFKGYNTHAGFHFDYLRAILNEHNIQYTKKHPREVSKCYYLNELINRTDEGHIKSFKDLIDFCSSIEEKVELDKMS